MRKDERRPSSAYAGEDARIPSIKPKRLAPCRVQCHNLNNGSHNHSSAA
jgi:hypothetical protein